MGQKHHGYTVLPFPRVRRLIMDSGRVGKRKHTVYGLFEVDVTAARRYLRAYKARNGESLSFTAFLIACLGRAVAKNGHVHAVRNWRNQLIIFDDVDVNTLVEVDYGDYLLPVAYVIRGANRRTVREIHAELRQARTDRARSLLPPAQQRFVDLFLLLPPVLRGVMIRAANRSPRFMKHVGTVVLTSVGMFGVDGGWAIGGGGFHTLNLIVGGIAQKPGVVDGRIEIREYLSLTIGADHDIVDGAPLARFANDLKMLIESAYGLTDVE